ncbi:hypothetical protein VNO78_23745 [Psophocarpus tetragonolobus]|uniref:Uncharacterized protein n=1 Tax=Psophocarpus tetragonolobus TaxID=3891 RepID=A0AAN9XE56_PSOTE
MIACFHFHALHFLHGHCQMTLQVLQALSISSLDQYFLMIWLTSVCFNFKESQHALFIVNGNSKLLLVCMVLERFGELSRKSGDNFLLINTSYYSGFGIGCPTSEIDHYMLSSGLCIIEQ